MARAKRTVSSDVIEAIPEAIDVIKDKLTAQLIGVLSEEFDAEIAELLQPMIPALMS